MTRRPSYLSIVGGLGTKGATWRSADRAGVSCLDGEHGVRVIYKLDL